MSAARFKPIHKISYVLLAVKAFDTPNRWEL